jgi:hypothetical protein
VFPSTFGFYSKQFKHYCSDGKQGFYPIYGYSLKKQNQHPQMPPFESPVRRWEETGTFSGFLINIGLTTVVILIQ